MKVTSEQIVELYNQAKETIEQAPKLLEELHTERRSLESLLQRTQVQLSVLVQKIARADGEVSQAKTRISQLNPFIYDAKQKIAFKKRLITECDNLEFQLARRKKALKEFNELV